MRLFYASKFTNFSPVWPQGTFASPLNFGIGAYQSINMPTKRKFYPESYFGVRYNFFHQNLSFLSLFDLGTLCKSVKF